MIDGQTHAHTHTHAGNDNTRRPKLASGKKQILLYLRLISMKSIIGNISTSKKLTKYVLTDLANTAKFADLYQYLISQNVMFVCNIF